MAERIVTGTLFRPGASTVWPGGTVVFELLTRFTIAGGVVLPYEVPARTGFDGSFTATLRVPDSGTAQYRVNFPDGGDLTFWLGAGASIGLDALFNGAGEVPVDIETLDALVAAALTAVVPVPAILIDASPIVWDFNSRPSAAATLTLVNDRSLTLTNVPSNFAVGTLVVTQSAGGGLTLSIPAGHKVVNGADNTLTLSSANGAVDVVMVQKVGSVYYWAVGLNYT